jgi:hypothetical protein
MVAVMSDPQDMKTPDRPVRKKALVLVFLMVTNLVGGLGLALAVDARLIWIAVILPALFGLLLATLRCPRCGEAVFRRKAVVRAGESTLSFGIPGACSKCGVEL